MLPFTISYKKYTLNFRRPAPTSRGPLPSRDTYFLRLTDKEDATRLGLGECGPIPGLSVDGGPGFIEKLAESCDFLNQGGKLAELDLSDYPSISFGLEVAWLDWWHGGQRQIFESDFSRGQAGVSTHGLIWMADRAGMWQQIQQKVEQGFSCIKMKIGALDFNEECALLGQIRAAYPAEQIELRLDANGAFTPENVQERLEALAEFDIFALEQPLKPGQAAAMAELCRTSPIPIALDEELIGIKTLEEKTALLETIRPHYLVLKPSLIGGFRAAETWIEIAQRLEADWWANSMLESTIGLNAISQWVSALDVSHIQGLGTGQLFTNNIPGPIHLAGDPSCTMINTPPGIWPRLRTDLKLNQHTISLAILKDNPKKITWAELTAYERKVLTFCQQWLSGQEAFTIHTSGSTGQPKAITLSRRQMQISAKLTGQALDLQTGDRALVCLSVDYVAGMMMLVRGFELGLDLTIIDPSSNPLETFPANTPFDFTALVPLQLQHILLDSPGKIPILDRMKAILIGGGPVSVGQLAQLQQVQAPVYHTYGMTETVTHIALKRLNGPTASECFTPLPGVYLGLDARGCLTIESAVTHGETLVTNDLVTLHPDGRFQWLGRVDHVINSGGVKIQIEQVETALEQIFHHYQDGQFAHRRFFVGPLPDERLGQMVVAIIEGYPFSAREEADILSHLRNALPKYKVPRYLHFTPYLLETATGKVDRLGNLERLERSL